MDEINFRKWLHINNKNNKVICDTISRLKRLEREFNNIDLDIEYKNDQCQKILKTFKNTGQNELMKQYNTKLPIGKYSLNTYKYALNLYLSYKENTI